MWIGLALALTVAVAGCSSKSPATPAASRPSPAPTEVFKEIFGSEQPASAKGQELYLYRVVIPVQAVIPLHTHPGLQFGHIMEGTLTYEVREGSATVIRQAGTPHETREDVTDRAVTLETGDTIIETQGDVHVATNNGTVPVVVMLASLIPKGDELSSPVPDH